MSEKKYKKKILLYIIIPILLLLITAVTLHQLGYIRYPWEPRMIISGKKGTLQGTGNKDVENKDSNNVTLIINSEPIFDDSGSKGSLMIENPESNSFDMKVEIYLGVDNSGELIYETNKILPGYYIDYDKLIKPLNKGKHKAIAYITFYDGDIQGNTTSVNLNIIIKN